MIIKYMAMRLKILSFGIFISRNLDIIFYCYISNIFSQIFMHKSTKKSRFDNQIMLIPRTFCRQARFNDSNCTCTRNSGSIFIGLCPLSNLMQTLFPLHNFKIMKKFS